MVAAGADALIVHARKAWLQGLSPKENRDVPPLDYARVYRLKQRLADFPVAINGGIDDLDAVEEHLRHVDGVMLGRAAYQNPGLLSDVDRRLFAGPRSTDPRSVVESMAVYTDHHVDAGGKASNVTRHMLGLFQGMPGARAWRRHLATEAVKPGATGQVLRDVLALVRDPGYERAA